MTKPVKRKPCLATIQSDSGTEHCEGKRGHRGMHWYTFDNIKKIVRVMWRKKRD